MDISFKKIPKSSFFVLLFVFVISFPGLLYASNIEEGAKLFKANCATCHYVNSNKLIGPGLEGVTVRVPSPYQDWMLKWIKDNNAFRKSGNAYANQIYADNNGVPMTVFGGTLTDDQIKSIIAFLADPPKQLAQDSINSKNEINSENSLVAAPNYKWILLIVIGILFTLIYVLRFVRKSLLFVAHDKEGLPAPEDLSYWKDAHKWIRTHKVHSVVICIFFSVLLSVYGWEYLWNIHVTPGYHPSQPIYFIHKVHADDNNIACLYCHSGAEKGKVAGIPTLNVCMNCHKGIQGSTPEYKKEIAKIYYAVGWDPVKGDYINPQHPVHWNRVNVLPDFAYFNHAQHVVVGKIACQKCHGDCSSFTTNQQVAPLTMGWCINCHRETPVQMDSNGYYTRLDSAIKKSFHKNKKVTEADMGGLECGKCHY
jgi:cytochrome c2